MKKIYQRSFLMVLIVCFSKNTLSAQCAAASIPYYEDFQGTAIPNQLPACWAASNPSVTCLTFASPLFRAGFFNNPVGANYFYTGALQLLPGITYSAATFYRVDIQGASGYSDLSIMIGSSQTPSGLTTIASTVGTINNVLYSQLSNTFTVPNAGQYYIAIRGTSTSSTTAQYLQFDDLSVTIPCGPSPINTPTYNIPALSGTYCMNDTITLDATVPGPYTHLWFNGATTPSVAFTFSNSPGIFSPTVAITNTLTNCKTNHAYTFTVNPVPSVFIVASDPAVCEGEPTVLSAYGASSYTWSSSLTGVLPIAGNVYTAVPVGYTSFSVIGSNAFGCKSTAVINVSVKPKPTITFSPSIAEVCAGEQITIVANGLMVYTWQPQGTGPSIAVSPLSNTTYSVSGTNMNGCKGAASILVKVDACTGASVYRKLKELSVYPNPTTEYVFIKNAQGATASVLDVFARHIKTVFISSNLQTVSLSELRSGIYFLRIEDERELFMQKIVKQ